VNVEGAGKGKIVKRGEIVLKQCGSSNSSADEEAAAQGREHHWWHAGHSHVRTGWRCIPAWRLFS